MFKRSPTRKLGNRAAGLAAIGAEFALAYAQQALEAANEAGRAGASKLEDLGETLGSSARSAGKAGAERAGDLSEAARALSRDAGKKLSKAIRTRFN